MKAKEELIHLFMIAYDRTYKGKYNILSDAISDDEDLSEIINQSLLTLKKMVLSKKKKMLPVGNLAENLMNNPFENSLREIHNQAIDSIADLFEEGGSTR